MFKKLIFFIFINIFIHNNTFSNVNRDRVVNYLEGFHSLKSEFVQINNNGDILSGNLYVSRPGKFRIEYNQIPLLLISDAKKLAVINKDLKNISFHKIDEVPVSVLLFKELSMSNISILKLKEKENMLSVELMDSKYKDQGFVEILFEVKPFMMKKWTIYKKDNTKTEVFFNNIFIDKKLSQKLFDIDSEDPRKIPFKIY